MAPRLIGSTLLALLALTLCAGAGLAGGDLFDDDYQDCPVATRLRQGEIADLTLSRDSDEESEVHVAWTGTHPGTWNLGPNAYHTSLVVILDDHHGEPVTRTVSLNTRQITFDKVKTGTEVTVQMAIVVDTAGGGYLISDILEQTLNQSLTEPSFATSWQRVTATADADATAAGFQFAAEGVAGTMFYIGHNENFGNYRSADPDFVTAPATPRLRIGLAHSRRETDDQREDVDFDAYRIRILDADGDAVPAADDVATVASNYGSTNQGTPALRVPHKLFLYDISSTLPLSFNPGPAPVRGTLGPDGYALVNVRISDNGGVTLPMHVSSAVANRDGALEPDNLPLTMVKVGIAGGTTLAVDDVFAEPPDEHRDLPNDILESDATYTITAWAVNKNNENISPVATLKVRPVDTHHGAITNFRDYQLASAVTLTDLVSTEFTVLDTSDTRWGSGWVNYWINGWATYSSSAGGATAGSGCSNGGWTINDVVVDHSHAGTGCIKDWYAGSGHSHGLAHGSDVAHSHFD